MVKRKRYKKATRYKVDNGDLANCISLNKVFIQGHGQLSGDCGRYSNPYNLFHYFYFN